VKAVERKKKKTAKVFGIPTEAQWKKGNLPLASTSETLRSCATLDAGFTFYMELGSLTPSRYPKNLSVFFFFLSSTESPSNEKKESAVSARRS
jgi:hypothetical protein